MLLHDYIFIGLFIALLIPKDSRYAAIIFLAAYISYTAIYPQLPDNYYHAFSSTLNLFIFLTLLNNHKSVAFLSLSLAIPVNFFGYMSYMYYMPADNYNKIYLTIVAIQIFLLFTRMLLNAYINRRNYKRAMVQLNSPDSYESFDPLHIKKEK